MEIADENNIKYVAAKDEFSSLFYYELESVKCSYLLYKERYLPKYYTFGQEFIEKELNNNYCCAAVAILNILDSYRCYNVNDISDISWAYSTIYSMGNVKKKEVKNEDDENNKEKQYQYVMNQEQMGGVLSTFAKWYGDKEIPYNTKDNPSISFFINAVDKKYPSILGITASYKGGIAGHAMSVIGYLKFKPIMYGEEKCYLAVATGWGYKGDIQYILYDTINVKSTYGVVFECK